MDTSRFQRRPSSQNGSSGNPHVSGGRPTSGLGNAVSPLPLQDSSWILGSSMRICTLADTVIEGEVFSYDTVSGVVILQRPAKEGPNPDGSARWDFSMVRLSNIKEILQCDRPPAGHAPPMPIAYVHLERIRIREARNIKDAIHERARRGIDVSEEGQRIFDALSKTLPCRWAKQSIVVLDEVIIAPPYTNETCKAHVDHASTLARVQRVLAGERSRMGLEGSA